MKTKTAGRRRKKWTEHETAAWIGLIRTQQYLVGAVEDALGKEGLPPLPWYDVLWELDKSPEGNLRLNEIGKRVLLDKYNVTRLVQRLENEGLVRRVPCAQDGRGIFAHITPKGRKLRERMWPVYERAVSERFFSKLGRQDISRLGSIMGRICDDTDG
ncbi:MAG TPA: MarR family winged helix-turn-helix transcriptional regulator [Thermodesulfobacteriota bacterium]|nr:MarR family winged helix-turn-helix transcriptional regulator [Thermodesulfobacteriota bacterium]